MDTTMPLLRVQGLCVAYGGIQAVRGIDFEVAEGELVCLIGANGAGKSSTLKGLMGLVRPQGEIWFAGERLHRLSTHAIVARGLAMVPEGRGIFGRLTVAENLEMGAYLRRDRDGIRADIARAYDLFERLAERRGQLAGTLSGGEQQMLAIARAMMGRPRLLLLDEPSMGLAPLMVQKIHQTIASIASEGVTILLVEQNAHMALALSHRAYVMESGVMTLSGAAAELRGNADLRAAYLGE
jgi:branched-chain amino acid transport system ATP-binding protein